jgi:ATP-binding protein involved in chromosome partitioning
VRNIAVEAIIFISIFLALWSSPNKNTFSNRLNPFIIRPHFLIGMLLMVITRESITEVLNDIKDPYLGTGISAAIVDFSAGERSVLLSLTLGYPAAGIIDGLKQQITDQIQQLYDGVEVHVQIDCQIESFSSGQGQAVAGVKNVIAVASGKGGVGKSTVAVNLALALKAEGARVGLLDADIYGPSQGSMLGVPLGTTPEIYQESQLEPIQAHGIQCMSMSFMAPERTPMVWRGPMASGALQQLVGQTRWDNLDYLVVDMPPGTGDIQLTLSQQVSLSGAVIVTTPQDIALLDAQKGIEMFRQVKVPVLGIVENMSVYICSECGHKDAIFGEGGGLAIAEDYDTRLLAGIPLSREIRQLLDNGQPPVAVDPESEVALIFRDMARKVASAICLDIAEGENQPVIRISDD